MSGFDEEMLEDYVIEQFEKDGWKFVKSAFLNRDTNEDILLESDLMRAIKRINHNKDLDDDEIIQAIKELKLKPSTSEGLKQVLNMLKYGVTIVSKRGREIKKINLFDFSNIKLNEYIVSRQVIYHGKEEIRTDVMLYVNGIPLANIELKNPASFSETWYNAYLQIKGYEKDVPELYKYVQIGVAAEQNALYFPIVPQLEDVNKSEWKEDDADPVNSVIKMLSKERILDLIRNYIFIREEAGMGTKVIARYMQYQASERIVNRVLNQMEGIDDKKNGLIWHWQGSGKTLTMIFAANKLYHLQKLENPSIFFILDRLDLENQLYQEFTALDSIHPEIIHNIDELKSLILHDEYKGKKGIFITIMQRFKPGQLDKVQEDLEKLEEMDKNTISSRENVITFIDEGHRTQYGTLAGQMRKILKSGFFFAFTGTPIAKKEKDTYNKFAYPSDNEAYLHRYFIIESIKDGFTLKIVYKPIVERDIRLDKNSIKAFSEVEFDELPEEIQDDVEIRVKSKLNAINVFLENPKRIEKVAKDIADNFKENLDGKFKAMVVAATRSACVQYKRALDKFLPPEYSEVIMTYHKIKDPQANQIIKEYEEELKTKYNRKNTEDIKKEVIENFKEEDSLPKILIVTDMLLTGFDAPILQTMYLDKPIKEHMLLQAVARTNRPYKDVKEAGYIVDYVGMIDTELKHALEIYGTDEIQETLYDIESMKNDFNKLMDETLAIFKGIPKNQYDREILLNAIEILTTDDENSDIFIENYRNLRRLFEFLGTDAIVLDRRNEFKWISAIYSYYMKMVTRDPSMDETVRKYYEKTIKFLHKATEFEEFEKNLPEIEFDECYLENLNQSTDSDEERAANIVFALNKFVLVNKENNPVYESVADKVERLREMWKTRGKDYNKLYQEGAEIFKQIQTSFKRQEKLDLSDLEYSMLSVLENKFGKNKELIQDVEDIDSIIGEDAFDGWVEQRAVYKKIEGNIRRFIRKKYYKKFNMNMNDLEELNKQIMEKVEKYAE
ncbi:MULTISPECIES: type I restriction endonuclease subunit R [Methanobacterium]|uniref:type I site-specific deoxyribonuclease n=1 Tax=Methanobacterium veterum TaxID=408577 RepID=A0A9E5DKP8_9EURY|nr:MULTISPECIES: HsdR family type I site-specific deoxyribonuclease [Methanobacterium]MCZ3366538.1 HsdR family type I site-specific deoxyribonuclease [Methanobacterium veterum]MCZ3371753.1 HsdR family type I site-specific deoxyribonuclease [Methanobacterium veterum]